MGLSDLVKELKKKKDIVDGSQYNIPIGGASSDAVETAFHEILDPQNIMQTTNITQHDATILSILDAYTQPVIVIDPVTKEKKRQPLTIQRFSERMIYNYLSLSSSVEGWKANSLCGVASGMRMQENMEEIARIRSQQQGNNNLKGV